MTEGAVVAFSGGQDSTTCLAWAIHRWGRERVHTVGFDYGQRHRVELAQARRIAELMGVPYTLLDVPAFKQLGAAALTNDSIAVSAEGGDNVHAQRHGLPSTFVPGRNLIFLGLTAAYAAQRDISNIVTGICAADEAGYPDCRPEFKASFELAVRAAMGRRDLVVHAPCLHITKADTFALAHRLGVLDVILEETHTCYEGDHDTMNPWGYGCGECPACHERAAGWDAYCRAAAE